MSVRPSVASVSEAIALGRRRLSGAEGARDVKLLLALAAQVPVDKLSQLGPMDLTLAVMDRFDGFLARRATGEPVSQIRGVRAFWRHDFEITSDVLDPRPETETLVEIGLEASFETVLDLGTGSGCILLSLLAERPGATGLGIDLSERALLVAMRNRKKLDLESRASFCASDWYSAVQGRFDLIVANPPYVDAAVYRTLSREVQNFEPRLALTPGEDGTRAYFDIVDGAADHLNPGGRILVEIGYDQGAAVAGIFSRAGFRRVSVRQDLGGRDRVVSAQLT
ncbi:MAG: peptide chain release factor N(5)-glutamine methyltransferase [Pseudomonadota bacterium]